MSADSKVAIPDFRYPSCTLQWQFHDYSLDISANSYNSKEFSEISFASSLNILVLYWFRIYAMSCRLLGNLGFASGQVLCTFYAYWAAIHTSSKYLHCLILIDWFSLARFYYSIQTTHSESEFATFKLSPPQIILTSDLKSHFSAKLDCWNAEANQFLET